MAIFETTLIVLAIIGFFAFYLLLNEFIKNMYQTVGEKERVPSKIVKQAIRNMVTGDNLFVLGLVILLILLVVTIRHGLF